MRIVIFMIQILFLTLFISLMKYEFSLNFDIDILNEQIFIMQFLAMTGITDSLFQRPAVGMTDGNSQGIGSIFLGNFR